MELYFQKKSQKFSFPLVHLLVLEFGPKGCAHLSYRTCFKGGSGPADKLQVCQGGIVTRSLLCQGVTPQGCSSWMPGHAWWITYSEKHSGVPTKNTRSSKLQSTRAAMIWPRAASQHWQTVMYTAWLYVHYKTVDATFPFSRLQTQEEQSQGLPRQFATPSTQECAFTWTALRKYGYDTHPFCDP